MLGCILLDHLLKLRRKNSAEGIWLDRRCKETAAFDLVEDRLYLEHSSEEIMIPSADCEVGEDTEEERSVEDFWKIS